LLPARSRVAPLTLRTLQYHVAAGRSHLALELATLPIWILAGAALGIEDQHLLVFALSYTLASIMLSPDLDLGGASVSRRWGPLRALWIPYTLMFRHRGLSHSLLWGPLTRVGYLAVLAAAGWLAFVHVWGIALGTPALSPVTTYLPALTAGLYGSHTLHVLLDKAGGLRYRIG